MLGSAQFARRELVRLEGEKAILEDRIKKLKNRKASKRGNVFERLKNSQEKLSRINAKIDETTSSIELFAKSVRPDFAEPFNPRYWRQDIIQERRQEFLEYCINGTLRIHTHINLMRHQILGHK